MAKKGALFDLIHTLSKSEKRYFKRFAGLHGAKSNYLILFDAVEMQTLYDEAKIKKQLKDHTFINQLHVTKNYLYKLILKSLRSYHQKRSPQSQLKSMSNEVALLFEKELYEQALQISKQAESLALKYEKYLSLLDIYSWKRRLLLARYGAGTVRNEINDILKQEALAISRLQQLNHYWNITINLMQFFQPDTNQTVKEDPLLQKAPDANCYQATILYHHIWYTLHIISNRTDLAGQQLDSLVQYIEDHPWQIKADPSSYITTLNNKIGLMLNLKSYEQIPELLEKTQSIAEGYGLQYRKHLAMKLQLRGYNIELEMYRDTGQFDKGLLLIAEVKKFMKEHQNNIPAEYLVLLHYQFAYLNFMTRNLREALKDINEILNFTSANVRDDIYSFTRFLNLIIHYELNNIIVLRYAVAATRRFLKKKRKLMPFEKVLLRFFARISTTPIIRQKELFTKLYQDLVQSHPPLLSESDLDYLDFKGWIEGKLAKVI